MKKLGLSDQQNASSHNDGWDGWHDRTFFTTKQLHRGKIRILVITGKFETKQPPYSLLPSIYLSAFDKGKKVV